MRFLSMADRAGDRRSKAMRRSGRTSRMLAEAIDAKAAGENILIIVHEHQMIHYCMQLMYKHGWDGVLDPYRDFATPRNALKHGRLRGLRYRNIFVDHAVWEMENPSVLSNLAGELEWMKQLGPALPYFKVEAVVEDPWCECAIHDA